MHTRADVDVAKEHESSLLVSGFLKITLTKLKFWASVLH